MCRDLISNNMVSMGVTPIRVITRAKAGGIIRIRTMDGGTIGIA